MILSLTKKKIRFQRLNQNNYWFDAFLTCFEGSNLNPLLSNS